MSQGTITTEVYPTIKMIAWMVIILSILIPGDYASILSDEESYKVSKVCVYSNEVYDFHGFVKIRRGYYVDPTTGYG